MSLAERNRTRGGDDAWPEVQAELVISLHGGPRLLIACVDCELDSEWSARLGSLTRGAAQPRGTAAWIPHWSRFELAAMRLRARLVESDGATLRLHFPLPRCARTLRALPDRIAVTDRRGLADLERTRSLPRALLLPRAPTEVLAEHIVGG